MGRVLEMNALEFGREVENQLEANPALEKVETTESQPLAETAPTGSNPDDEDGGYDSYGTEPGRGSKSLSWVPDTEGESLYSVMMGRVKAEGVLAGRGITIASHIIGNLDSSGYLRRSLPALADEIAMSEGFEPTEMEVGMILTVIQSMEPAGIGARDLRECLLLQLSPMLSDEAQDAKTIVGEHFEDFAKMRYERLLGATQLSKERLVAALDLIKTLNPRPGASLTGGGDLDNRPIYPDVNVDYDPENKRYTVSLLNEAPALAVEESFRAGHLASPGEKGERQRQALAFIRDRRNEAEAFIRLAEMRSETLLNVSRSIVLRQNDFFATGDRSMIKPMILKDIASDTGLDISAVSRAVNGKYVQTASGIFPLKLFFTERPNENNHSSSVQIQEALRALLECEDPHKPMSDRELTEALASEGMTLARRTVANYREKLGYGSARQRKKF